MRNEQEIRKQIEDVRKAYVVGDISFRASQWYIAGLEFALGEERYLDE